ncbi:hypothetical protein PCE31106_00142 [Pandoraea cepalis]|uniref:Uncharacterized protein n=1 Tax=Pandoraea cepalis TaxID=2508294 RepID=A0A5E4RF49_9BURK|nr:hypothetical protein [Pandoraea cepalis]VVD61940.1 hypothetical protein PCE31106_00142 [Pandoraea cepalis]
MPESSVNPNTKRWKAWLANHATDRVRIGPLTLVRGVVANVDREAKAIAISRTLYIGASLLAMESLPPSERQRFLDRYAELVEA